MAAGSPRRNTGPGGQSICGERMRSPAPGQRLQVTGGILKFTIYQGPFVKGCRSARGGEKLNLDTLASNSFSQFVVRTARTCIHQTAESQQSCSPGVQTTPPTPLSTTRGDRLISQVVKCGGLVAGWLQCGTDCLTGSVVEMVNKRPHLTSQNRYLK